MFKARALSAFSVAVGVNGLFLSFDRLARLGLSWHSGKEDGAPLSAPLVVWLINAIRKIYFNDFNGRLSRNQFHDCTGHETPKGGFV
jgi:hypothetical protein